MRARAARAALDERFQSLTEGVAVAPAVIELKGRTLNVPRAAGGVARIGFDALCVEARGAADYLALAAHFHSLVLDNIPLLQPQKKMRPCALSRSLTRFMRPK